MNRNSIDSKSELKEIIAKSKGIVVGDDAECPDVFCLIQDNDNLYGLIGFGGGVRPVILKTRSNKIIAAIGDKLYIFENKNVIFVFDNQSYLIDEVILLNEEEFVLLSQLDIKKINIELKAVVWSRDFNFIENYTIENNIIEIETETDGYYKCIIRENGDILVTQLKK